MNFDRKPETERLIEFLSGEDMGLVTYGKLVKAIADPKYKSIDAIRGYLYSALRVLRSKHGMKYGTIRGVGIQRMTADETAFHGDKRRKRAGKQLKEGRKDNALVVGNNSLSAAARATLSVNEVIFTKAIYDLDGAKKMIKVATADDKTAMVDIVAAMASDVT